MKKRAVVFGLAFLSLVMVQSAFSQTAKKKFQSSNWNTACQKATSGIGKVCRMSRAIRKAGGGSPLLVTAVQRDLKNRGYMLVLRLPHGLNLPAGVRLQIDRQKVRRLAVLSSDRGGTFTRVNLSAKVLGALKKGRKLTISFATISGQRFVIPVSLEGFTTSFKRLAGMQ